MSVERAPWAPPAPTTRTAVMGSLREILREISAATDLTMQERLQRKENLLKQVAYVVGEHRVAFLQARRVRRGS